MPDPTTVRFRGPLLAYRAGFWTQLLEQGYSPLTGMNLLRLAAHLSRWLEEQEIVPRELTSERVEDYAAHRCKAGYTGYRTPRALQPLLGYLRELNVVPSASAPPVDTSPIGRLLNSYERYLVEERGIGSIGVRSRIDVARRLLNGRTNADLSDLTAHEVVSFVLGECRRDDGGYSRGPATATRSLLRFLELRDEVSPHLGGCVPAMAQWRLASLPKILEPAQVQDVLAACDDDRDGSIACRDGAIVRLLVRLGLRAGEVASLLLDDIDWRAGEVLVRGKGKRTSRMPVPRDVGQALATYLRHHRPSSKTRNVFLGVRAPFRPLTSGGIVHVAARALRSSGISSGGAHLLRHTAASQLLRSGASLAEVGHVLRHRHLDTTAIYAKVDDASLRELARPWPGGAACV